MRLILILTLTFGFSSWGASFKDGRQYYLDLTRRLQLPQNVMTQLFNQLRGNLPKQGSAGDYMSGMLAIAKLASSSCTEASYFAPEMDDVSELYMSLLDRAPTDAEKAKALRNPSGKIDFFANCFFLAMHPEFLKLKGK